VLSLPVQLGVTGAAKVACAFMLIPQLIVIGLHISWGLPWFAVTCIGLLLIQVQMMRVFLRSPLEKALFYSGFGVPVFVLGMMVSAFGLRLIH
jgi:chlorophyll/bacteriochlorophyll a synthase